MIQFGTTTLPLAGWIANARQPEASRSHRLRAIQQIVEHYGLQAVELTLDLQAIYPRVFDERFYNSVADMQQSLGFACTVHLPFLWVEPASVNESIRLASVACMLQAVEVSQAITAHTYVLHLWGFATMQVISQLRESAERQILMDALMSQADRSLATICEFIEPGRLCVENLEDSLFDLALPIIDQHGASICLDVGHLTMQGGSALDFLEHHGERIREIHLHDAIAHIQGERQHAQDHLALGEGHVDYATLLGRLLETGYQGPIILEVNDRASLEKSLDRVRATLRTHHALPARS